MRRCASRISNSTVELHPTVSFPPNGNGLALGNNIAENYCFPWTSHVIHTGKRIPLNTRHFVTARRPSLYFSLRNNVTSVFVVCLWLDSTVAVFVFDAPKIENKYRALKSRHDKCHFACRFANDNRSVLMFQKCWLHLAFPARLNNFIYIDRNMCDKWDVLINSFFELTVTMTINNFPEKIYSLHLKCKIVTWTFCIILILILFIWIITYLISKLSIYFR